jgi:hypothetical protein
MEETEAHRIYHQSLMVSSCKPGKRPFCRLGWRVCNCTKTPPVDSTLETYVVCWGSGELSGGLILNIVILVSNLRFLQHFRPLATVGNIFFFFLAKISRCPFIILTWFIVVWICRSSLDFLWSDQWILLMKSELRFWKGKNSGEGNSCFKVWRIFDWFVYMELQLWGQVRNVNIRFLTGLFLSSSVKMLQYSWSPYCSILRKILPDLLTLLLLEMKRVRHPLWLLMTRQNKTRKLPPAFSILCPPDLVHERSCPGKPGINSPPCDLLPRFPLRTIFIPSKYYLSLIHANYY